MRSITTVVTKATSRDLTTLAHAKEELNIKGTSYDARLRRWITEESAAVERYVGRRLVKETLQQTFTAVDLGTRSDLILVLYPVSEVVSVTWDGTALTPDQWMLDGEAGLLRRFDAVNGCCISWYDWRFCSYSYLSTVVVEYTGGWTQGDDLPPDIEAATLMQVGHRKSAGTRDQTIKSQTVPNVLSTTYWIPNAGDNAAIIPPAASRLEPYREYRV